MNYKLSILNITSGIFIGGILVYSLVNYTALSKSEGWGIVAMACLLVCGVILFVIDLLLQLFIKKRKTVHIIEAVILLVVILLIFIFNNNIPTRFFE